MKKWTNYGGALICEVEVRTNMSGMYTGYYYQGSGVHWAEPLKELPPGFYDSEAECLAGVRREMLGKANRDQCVLTYLEDPEIQDAALLHGEVVQEYLAEQISSKKDSIRRCLEAAELLSRKEP